MAESLLEDLRQQIAAGQVVVVTGAGVAGAVSGGARTATWTGLLDEAIAHCEACVPGLPEGWPAEWRATLAQGDVPSLLRVADQVTDRLGGRSGGEYRRFLRSALGELPVVDPAVPEALASWGVPVVTTNYDSLIEQATGRRPVTWRDVPRLQRVLRGSEQAIAHLHGHWEDPESVVLGLRSYDELLDDPGAQGLQHALVALRSLVLVGMGEGVSDPNWGPLRTWAALAFGTSEYRHFRLCRRDEVDRLAAEHAGERVVPVAYGPDHAALPGFLRSLAPPERPVMLGTRSSTGVPARLPARPQTTGRQQELEALVALLVEDPSRPVVVLGAPGIGKTHLTVAAAHDPAVVARYGDRRSFVRAERASSAAGLAADLAAAVGVTGAGADPLGAAVALLGGEPALVVIDNAETAWEADALATEDLFAAVAAVPGVALVVSLRGGERPGGPAWAPPLRLGPLDTGAARQMFLGIAGDRFDDDRLGPLLDEMGGLPLAIELLAHTAETEPDSAGLATRWQQEQTRMLERAGGGDRRLSVAVSCELSWHSGLLTDPARRLLSLLALLPDGAGHRDLDRIMPGEGSAAAGVLRQRALAFDDAGRLRVHPPLRHHLRRAHPPDEADWRRALAFYLSVATGLGAGPRGDEAARLLPEAANMTRACIEALAADDPRAGLAGVSGLTYLSLFTGADVAEALTAAVAAGRRAKPEPGDDTPEEPEPSTRTAPPPAPLPGDDLQRRAREAQREGEAARGRYDYRTAREAFDLAARLHRQAGNTAAHVLCLERLGDVASALYDHAAARRFYDRARAGYTKLGNPIGRAQCIENIGHVAYARNDYATARRRYEEAFAIFKREGNVLGQAGITKSLGDIARSQRDEQVARHRYGRALILYERIDSTHGQANCLYNLGLLAIDQSEPRLARGYFQKAAPLYARIENVHGQAACLWGRADVAFVMGDYRMARDFFERSFLLYEEASSLIGEADCLHGLGRVAAGQTRTRSARGLWLDAVKRYERAQARRMVGHVHRRLARIATSAREQQRHVSAARAAWIAIGRLDLVAELEGEFVD